jgi:hypothetical protein
VLLALLPLAMLAVLSQFVQQLLPLLLLVLLVRHTLAGRLLLLLLLPRLSQADPSAVWPHTALVQQLQLAPLLPSAQSLDRLQHAPAPTVP